MSALPKYYTTLFQGVNMALDEIEKENYAAAKELLIRAQRESEGLYMLVDDWLRENAKKVLRPPPSSR